MEWRLYRYRKSNTEITVENIFEDEDDSYEKNCHDGFALMLVFALTACSGKISKVQNSPIKYNYKDKNMNSGNFARIHVFCFEDVIMYYSKLNLKQSKRAFSFEVL